MTLFACSVRAAALLPRDLAPDPEAVRVSYRLHAEYERRPSGIALASGRGWRTEDANAAEDLVRPLVAREPVSGKRALVGTYHVRAVRDPGGTELPFDASNDFVERAWAPGLAEGNVYAHAWRPGDLVLWSNRLVTHTATPVVHYAGQTRLLHRVRLRPPRGEGLRPWRTAES